MGHLSLALLGEPVVRHGGRRVSFRTRKSLALLAYLAVEGGLHTRNRLATLLWPKAKHRTGRKRLRNALYYLRRPLQHEGGAESAEDHLLADRQHIGLDSDAGYRLDVEQLLAADPQADAAELEATTDLYRGAFMAGFNPGDTPEYDSWVAEKRQKLELKACSLLKRLAVRLEQRKLFQQAVQVAMRWSNIAPLDERAYLRLMQLHLATGNRAAAQQAFETCRRRLREELNLEPSLQMQTVAEQIRNPSRR